MLFVRQWRPNRSRLAATREIFDFPDIFSIDVPSIGIDLLNDMFGGSFQCIDILLGVVAAADVGQVSVPGS